MTPALRQLGALLALRWSMLRSGAARVALLLSALVVGWLVHSVTAGAALLDPVSAATVAELAPATYLGFGTLALLAPLTSGGGQDVVPPDQLLGYPVRPGAQFLGGLLLAPLNLVWLIQLLVVTGTTAVLAGPGRLGPAALTAALFVVGVTLLGQAAAWTVAGLRATRRGRRVLLVGGLALLAAVVAVVAGGLLGAVLAASPTHRVTAAVVAGGRGESAGWLGTTAALLVLCAVLAVAGARACAWSLRRPSAAAARASSAEHARRSPRRGRLQHLVAVDRASVWRAAPLRRGGLVLAVLPGLLALAAALPWESLIVLPGLVAAAAGLLFGVNAFCLDASGAIWLASLPHSPRLLARAKALVLSETVLGAVTLSVALGAMRAVSAPTPAELSALLSSVVTCSALVVALCLGSSVRRPHRAELVGIRDSVVPPGALAAASLRLAIPTSLTGAALAVAAQTEVWWLPPAVAAPVLVLAGLSLARTARHYDDPRVRARVVLAVASG